MTVQREYPPLDKADKICMSAFKQVIKISDFELLFSPYIKISMLQYLNMITVLEQLKMGKEQLYLFQKNDAKY